MLVCPGSYGGVASEAQAAAAWAQVKDHFGNPVVPDEDKLELLEKIGSQAGFSQHTQNFLGLLVQARRFDVIDEIVAAFEQKYCSITDTQVPTPPPPLAPRTLRPPRPVF